jgi:hypothetical protein
MYGRHFEPPLKCRLAFAQPRLRRPLLRTVSALAADHSRSNGMIRLGPRYIGCAPGGLEHKDIGSAMPLVARTLELLVNRFSVNADIASITHALITIS